MLRVRAAVGLSVHLLQPGAGTGAPCPCPQCPPMTVKSWKGWFLCQLDQHRSLILAEDGGCGSWLSPGWLHWHTQSCNCASPRVSAGTVLCPALDMGYSTAPPSHRQRNQLIFSASTGPQPPHFESDHLLMAGAFGT